MKLHFLAAFFSAGLMVSAAAHAVPQVQYGANIIKENAISYAMRSSQDAGFDVKTASRQLYLDTKNLVEVYNGGGYNLVDDVTSAQCFAENAKLDIDSQTFIKKALGGQYKTISMVNGNLVMLIAGGAGELTFTVIDKGHFCSIDKSIHDSYWAANIIRMGIDGLDVTFS